MTAPPPFSAATRCRQGRGRAGPGSGGSPLLAAGAGLGWAALSAQRGDAAAGREREGQGGSGHRGDPVRKQLVRGVWEDGAARHSPTAVGGLDSIPSQRSGAEPALAALPYESCWAWAAWQHRFCKFITSSDDSSHTPRLGPPVFPGNSA